MTMLHPIFLNKSFKCKHLINVTTHHHFDSPCFNVAKSQQKKKVSAPKGLRNGDISKFRNTFFSLWNLFLDSDVLTPGSLSGLPFLFWHITQTTSRPSHLIPPPRDFSLSIPSLIAALPHPSSNPTDVSLFHVPPPQITKNFIPRVCGAVCRDAYGASCIINDDSATHVFY